jgi:hypothetical protein
VVLRRVLSRFRRAPDASHAGQLEKVPDSHPKSGLFTEPVRVADLRVRDPETLEDGSRRVTFQATIRDAEDRRCPDLSVEAVVTGPERTGGGQSTTDLMGSVKIRMAGPPGTYRVEIVDVAAGGLRWDVEAGPRSLDTVVD